jgi:hypothetical protein
MNAWTGDEVASGAISSRAQSWTLKTKPPEIKRFLRVPLSANPADWRHPDVGWGLVLPERPGLSPEQLATGTDAPEPIQALLKDRKGATVLRYRPDSVNRFTHLRNYASQRDVAISGSPRGLGSNALPQYLLIYGSPAEIPWEMQYSLNASCAVGRLDLTSKSLENYITKLLGEWKGAGSRIDQAVAWAVDHNQGPQDITTLMRNAIAAEVFAKWDADDTLHGKAAFLDGSKAAATCAGLIKSLSEQKPALIVTTSHGQTGPLNDAATMLAKLGLPVDQDFQVLELDNLLAAWQPDGAIWYAHACCSAGSSDITLFRGLMEAGSPNDRVIQAVASLGAHTAPLPHALLGAEKPLRAFIGHVEPTFDWTLQQPSTGQYLTSKLQKVLYDNIYSAKPVGLAFRDFYMPPLGELLLQHDMAREAFNRGENTLHAMLYCQLAARDVQSLVILGDPTAVLPLLP